MTQLGKILTVQSSYQRFSVCLVIFLRRLDLKYPAVVVLRGMQLLCETSWYPEILDEIQAQIQEPCRGAWGGLGMEKGLRLLFSLLLLHCIPFGPFWGPTLLCGGRSPAPARLGCPRDLFVLPLIALIWGNCRCLLPYPLISRAALLIF